MANKNIAKLTVAAAGLAGAGAAVLLAKKHRSKNVPEKKVRSQGKAAYHNTERGMHQKNSKGIYYTSGN